MYIKKKMDHSILVWEIFKAYDSGAFIKNNHRSRLALDVDDVVYLIKNPYSFMSHLANLIRYCAVLSGCKIN